MESALEAVERLVGVSVDDDSIGTDSLLCGAKSCTLGAAELAAAAEGEAAAMEVMNVSDMRDGAERRWLADRVIRVALKPRSGH